MHLHAERVAEAAATPKERLSQLVDLARPLRLAVARSAAEREAIYRLRCQTVIAQGWAQPEDFPDGMEHDAYDSRAVLIGGWDGQHLAATIRLVPPVPEAALPVENFFNLTLAPQGQVAEIGRIIVAPAYQKRRHVVFMALLCKACLEAWDLGLTHIGGSDTPSMLRLYRMLGCQLTIVGPAKRHWGEERFPITINLNEEAVSSLTERWYRLATRG